MHNGRLQAANAVQLRDAEPLDTIQGYLTLLIKATHAEGALAMLSTEEDVPLAIADSEFEELSLPEVEQSTLFSGESVCTANCLYFPLFSQRFVVGYLRLRYQDTLSELATALAKSYAQLITKELELAHTVSQLAYQNETVIRKQRELEDVISLKNNILSVTTHDLKNPIAAIQGYAELLEDGLRAGLPVDAESLSFMQYIKKGATTMSELVEQLNEVALLELNQLDVQSVKVDMNWLLQDEAEMMRLQAKKKSQGFDIEVSDRPIYVEVDLPKCKRILFNLIGNAIKYTPEGGHIRIWCESDLSTCKVHVKDNGIGIKQHKIDAIFEPFRKLRKRGTSGEFSSGLGLFISNYLVRLFQGSIQVQSAPGVGSVFTVLLPLAKEEF
jgi:signal transduction histidine kinase